MSARADDAHDDSTPGARTRGNGDTPYPTTPAPSLLLLNGLSPRGENFERNRLKKIKYKKKNPVAYKRQHALAMRRSHAKKYVDLKARLQVLLGQHCACCGETEPDFLTLDHIQGGGRYHRKSKPKTYEVWAEVLRTPNARERYRLLCWNCNCATKNGKVCPHNRKEVEAFLSLCADKGASYLASCPPTPPKPNDTCHG